VARDTFFGHNMVGQAEWERRGAATTAAASAISAALPVGVISAYWGTTAPAGWLLCDGAAIPAAYTTLIALVGANTPNLKGKVLVGLNAAETEFDALGETGGSKTATAAHTHDLTNHTHSGTSGGQTANHSHNAINVYGTSDTAHGHYIGGAPGNLGSAPQGAGVAASAAVATDGTSVDHTHGFTSGVPSSNTSGASSVGAASGNLPPYATISYIIKAV
jgi:microcystin-dependent protein